MGVDLRLQVGILGLTSDITALACLEKAKKKVKKFERLYRLLQKQLRFWRVPDLR